MLGGLISAGANLIGGLIGNKNQREINETNVDVSREYAQSGIQWRVADAKAAGIHPLVALGSNYQPSAPISVGSSALPDAFSSMGQSLGRAADSVLTREERNKKTQLDALTLERASLENELLRSQISTVNRANNPTLPSFSGDSTVLPGQSDGRVKIVPNELVSSDRLGKDAGTLNTYSHSVNHDGSVSVLPSKDAKDLMEDMGPLPWVWYARTALNRPPKPKEMPRKGYTWVWNPATLTYSQRPLQNWKKVSGKWLRSQGVRFNRW